MCETALWSHWRTGPIVLIKNKPAEGQYRVRASEKELSKWPIKSPAWNVCPGLTKGHDKPFTHTHTHTSTHTHTHKHTCRHRHLNTHSHADIDILKTRKHTHTLTTTHTQAHVESPGEPWLSLGIMERHQKTRKDEAHHAQPEPDI